jgi:hypothetical protein
MRICDLWHTDLYGFILSFHASILSIHKLDFELPLILNFDYLDADPVFNLDADPNTIFHFDADPDPAGSGSASKKMRIRLRNTGCRYLALVTSRLVPCY